MSLPTKNWWKMSEIYKIFCEAPDADFSLRSAQELFDYESKGHGLIGIDTFAISGNGYAIGKKWCNVQVAAWLEDLEKPGWFFSLKEIYSDRKFPKWWLNKIFKNFIKGKKETYKDAPKNIQNEIECLTEEFA